MERKELVVGIKNALDEVTKAVISATNELRTSMNEKVAIIANAKRELAEDNETLTDISIMVSDFVEDMTEIGANLEEVTNTVDAILCNLDNVPDELETYSEKLERVSEEDTEDFGEEVEEIED